MKKFAWLLMIWGLVGWSSASWAVNKCGVGPTVVGGSNTLLAQMGATFTDGFSSTTNLSAITSGTSGCSNDGFVQSEQQKLYVAHNYENLEEALAQGEGPYLDSLLAVLGCSKQAKAPFVALTKEHYDQLFRKADELEQRTDDFLQTLDATVLTHPSLHHQCQPIS